MNEDEHRGYREYGTCGDENCIKNLQERIAALERKAPGDEPGAGSVQQGMKLIQDSI